jgi:DNA-binding response OmpR family regulator
MKIIIIDDDEEIINVISLTLRVGWPDAEIMSARLGRHGLELVEAWLPDLVVLDLGLPDISGFEVLKSIRLFSDVPVVILTVSDQEYDVVQGLEMGANDYIKKPFRQMELLARLKAASKVLHSPEKLDECIKIGLYNFYPSLRKLKKDGRQINLTPTESTILLQLARNRGKTVTHESIAQKLWEGDYPGSIEAIRVYIGHLRKKIEAESNDPFIIMTNPGTGYYLSL